MRYKFFVGADAESEHAVYMAIERAHGRRAYAVRYRAGTIEVRSW